MQNYQRYTIKPVKTEADYNGILFLKRKFQDTDEEYQKIISGKMETCLKQNFFRISDSFFYRLYCIRKGYVYKHFRQSIYYYIFVLTIIAEIVMVKQIHIIHVLNADQPDLPESELRCTVGVIKSDRYFLLPHINLSHSESSCPFIINY